VFRVNVAGTVRVQAADELEARKVVPAVLLLPGPDEVRMANDSNANQLPCEGWHRASQDERGENRAAATPPGLGVSFPAGCPTLAPIA